VKKKCFISLFFIFCLSFSVCVFGETSDTERKNIFEVKYKAWRKDVDQFGPILSDDSGISLDSFKKEIVNLGVKFLPILIEKMHQDICLAYAITLISGWRFIPGEVKKKEIYGFKALANFYSNWWKEGQIGIFKLFEERYDQWLKVRNSSNKEDVERTLRNLSYLGIAALPYFFEKIKNNETAFIPIVSKLTKNSIKPTFSIEDCLGWWKKNKEDWTIPFPDFGIIPTFQLPAPK
jgi:hypothetical protein